jgi:hypothetical protein
MGVGGHRHALTVLPRGKRPSTHFTGGWVGTRAGLGGAEILVPTGIRSTDLPPRSELM